MQTSIGYHVEQREQQQVLGHCERQLLYTRTHISTTSTCAQISEVLMHLPSGGEHHKVESITWKLCPHRVGQDGHHAKHPNQDRNQHRRHHCGPRVEEDEQGKILPGSFIVQKQGPGTSRTVGILGQKFGVPTPNRKP